MRGWTGFCCCIPPVSAVGYEGAGDFTMDQLGRVAFRDPREVAPFVYASIQILHPRFFADAPAGAFSLHPLWRRAIEAGRLYGLRHDGEWYHVVHAGRAGRGRAPGSNIPASRSRDPGGPPSRQSPCVQHPPLASASPRRWRRGCSTETAADPLALSAYRVLLPTRRACRALQETFLRLSEGRPLLLPRLEPLGDIDADELILAGGGEGGAAVSISTCRRRIAPLRRQLLLTRAILAAGHNFGSRPLAIDQAARLAASWPQLLDQMATERWASTASPGSPPAIMPSIGSARSIS